MTALPHTFEQAVNHQIELLNSGEVLQALDIYFDDKGKMYENDNLFGSNKIECRTKQEPYINSAKEIAGKITNVKVLNHVQVCIFRNKSRFIDQENKAIQIDGIHWQQWENGKIIEERYYHGDKINDIIALGLMDNPDNLKDICL
ncbi:MAG: hypothetical protein V7776_06475 [Halopseudomonas aestusnigri]